MRIFCIPYAGGSSAVFAEWQKFMPNNIEVVNPELAGRGIRSGEGFYRSISEAAYDLYNKILYEYHDGDKFAVFGHSMGCFIAYELCKLINRNDLLKSKLVHVFMSGNYAPHLNGDEEHFTEYHKLDHEGFRRQILNMDGTSAEIFDVPALRNYFVPIIRSDYYITENYRTKEIVEFPCECSVLNGVDDVLTYNDLHSWKKYSPAGFEIKNFDGNHFFINDHKKSLIDYIINVLRKYG